VAIPEALASKALLAKNRHITHPMKEDVKKKHFSSPLPETREW